MNQLASRRHAVALLAVLTLTSCGRVWAQGGDLDQLRKQIDALEQQLNAAEKSRNVTQIGSSRRSLRDPSLVVRIYDLGDLFAVAPPYPAYRQSDVSNVREPLFPSPGAPTGTGFGGGGFGGGGGFFSTPAEAAMLGLAPSAVGQAGSADSVRTSREELIGTIKQTISPELWDDAGGPATIAQLGNAFVISADEATHEQIDNLLNLFRKRWGTLRTVSVQAHWLWLSDQQLGELLGAAGDERDIPAFGQVSEAAWKKLLTQSADQQPNGYRAVVTCYNGQTVHTLAGGQSTSVTDLRPNAVEADDGTPRGRVAYRPKVSLIQEGAVLQVTPMTNVSGRFVLLDIHSRISRLLPSKVVLEQVERIEQPAARDEVIPRDVVEAIDRPQLSVQRLSTTLRVPVGRPYLVGGMTFPGVQDDARRDLYLFVRVAVQELRDDLDHAADAADGSAGEDASRGDAAPDDAGDSARQSSVRN